MLQPAAVGRLPKPFLQFRGKREQCNIARSLDRFAQPTLVTRTCASHAARKNLAALLHERLEHLRLLVIDEVNTLDAKSANFLLAEILTFSATARASGSASRSAGPSTFTALSTATTAGIAAFATLPAAGTSRSTAFTALPTAGMAFGAGRAGSGRTACRDARCCTRCFCCWYRLIGHRVSSFLKFDSGQVYASIWPGRSTKKWSPHSLHARNSCRPLRFQERVRRGGPATFMLAGLQVKPATFLNAGFK
jgi:hypothetical protein